MKRLSSEIEISAPPERVWQVLTDFAAVPGWNPFIRSVEGELKTGERLRVHLKPPDGMGMTFRPTVLKAEPGSELRWIGRFLTPGLFEGEHYFVIEPLDAGRVRFVQGETFTGFLVPVMSLVGLFKNIQAGFEAMNGALKERAESSVGQ
jgi:hypothetical protein